MDSQQKLMISGVALLALIGLAFFMVKNNTGDTQVEPSTQAEVQIADLNKTEITEVQITRPGGTPITLTKSGETWRVTAPVNYAADMSAVTTMLDKLDTLEVVGTATRRSSNHAAMEVDDAHGIHVIAKAGTRVLADVFIGVLRSNNTLVRPAGQDGVAMVEGSVKFAFDRELRDWRDKLIHTLAQDQITRIEFQNPGTATAAHGNFVFERPLVAAAPVADAGTADGGVAQPTLGDWRVVSANYLPAEPPAGEDAGTKAPRRPRGPQTAITNFAISRLSAVVSTLADLRCSDFAATDITAEAAGISAASPRVTFTLRDGSTTTLIIGGEQSADTHNVYLMKEGNPTVFVVTQYVRDRAFPTVDLFAEDPSAANAAPPPPAMPEGMDMGAMGGMGGGGGNIPPELMRQIQAQMAAQGH